MRLIAVISLFAAVSPAAALGDEATTRSPELKVLSRFVGTWDAESVSKPAAWTPQELRETSIEVDEWVLDGWFVQGTTKGRGGKANAISMITYDPMRKEYHFSHFSTGGFVSQWSGQWDEANQTFSLRGDAAKGITSTGTVHFIDRDRREFHLIAKDRDGKVYYDVQGTSTRRVDKR